MTAQKLTEEQKAAAVKRLNSKKISGPALAAELGVHESSIYNWRKKMAQKKPKAKKANGAAYEPDEKQKKIVELQKKCDELTAEITQLESIIVNLNKVAFD